MVNTHTKTFNITLLRALLYYSNQIDEKTTEKEIFGIFDNWLEKNKEFRVQISKLSKEHKKEYIKTLENQVDITLKKTKKDLFMGFDRITYFLRLIVLKYSEKPKTKLQELSNHIEEQKKPKLTPYTFKDFLLREDKKEYYIKNMFASGTINMIYSPPASMKSFVSYYLGLCMATGTQFLNQKTKKVNICYFDWENPISDVQNRLKGICKGMKLDCNSIDNFYLFPRQPTLLTVSSYDSYVVEEIKLELINFIKDNNIKVIFFDTLRRLGNFDENDSKAINTIKSELFDPLVNECGVCIIFLHHTSKAGEQYRGSVDIEGILDTAYMIKKNDQQEYTNLTIKNTKRRNNELMDLNCVVEFENSSHEDEDGDMFEIIDSVKFSKTNKEDTTEDDNNLYGNYRTYFIKNLIFGEQYKNKDLIAILQNNFSVNSSNTTTRIIKWLERINILKSFGENKSKYYILNSAYSDKEDELKLKELEKHFKGLFQENDLVLIETLKGTFEEKFYSLIVSDWNNKGWVNITKKDYLGVTELYKSENHEHILDIEEVTL